MMSGRWRAGDGRKLRSRSAMPNHKDKTHDKTERRQSIDPLDSKHPFIRI